VLNAPFRGAAGYSPASTNTRAWCTPIATSARCFHEHPVITAGHG
jgi:hypothetical protein